MTTFTFFLKDGSIIEIEATDKDAAMRQLCILHHKSWYWMRLEIEACLAPEVSI